MSMLVEAEILRTLQQTVTAGVAASTMPGLPVQYVDVAFTQPDAGKPWLELVHLPNNGRDMFIDTAKQYMGSMRVILHWPIKGGGPYKAIEVLADVMAAFTKDAMLDKLQITDAPDLTGVLPDPPYMLYPATVRYARFAT